MTMTPQEQFEHKLAWSCVAAHASIHSDLRTEYTAWLKQECAPHEYAVQKYTNSYEDTVLFEHSAQRDRFVSEFNQWINPR